MGLSNKQKGGILESLYANSIPLFLIDKPLIYIFSLLNRYIMKQKILCQRFIDVRRREEHER